MESVERPKNRLEVVSDCLVQDSVKNSCVQGSVPHCALFWAVYNPKTASNRKRGGRFTGSEPQPAKMVGMKCPWEGLPLPYKPSFLLLLAFHGKQKRVTFKTIWGRSRKQRLNTSQQLSTGNRKQGHLNPFSAPGTKPQGAESKNGLIGHKPFKSYFLFPTKTCRELTAGFK